MLVEVMEFQLSYFKSYVSEVIDIFPGNFDSSFSFIQSSISHDVLYVYAERATSEKHLINCL